MVRTLHILILVSGLSPQLLRSQSKMESQYCYRETFPDSSKVFFRIENKPRFKGNHDSLLNYLIENISFHKLVSDLTQNERVYVDTARIKFIMSRDGIMSNLTVKHTKKKIFQDEIFRVIKKSSCLWIPGNFGRNIDGWFQLDIYYLIDRRYNEITTKVKFKEYDFATD